MDDTFIKRLAEKELADIDIDILYNAYLLMVVDYPALTYDIYLDGQLEMMIAEIEDRLSN